MIKLNLVPDDVIFSLVATRLKQPDCQIHGYVLEGFPKCPSQVQLLEDLKINPTVVVCLEKPDAQAKERASKTRLDPLTGEFYDLSANLNLAQEVKDRLVTRPQDTTENIQKR